MPANPSPVPEVLAKLAEIERSAARWPHSQHETIAWLCGQLRDALTALAAATREAETLRAKAGALLKAVDVLTLNDPTHYEVATAVGLPALELRQALAPRSLEGEGP